MSGWNFPVGLFTLLANHHGISQPSATVLGACFLLMAPFRTRFSPCEMVRTANVQRLKGCLYTLWYCYIPICRFARHSLFPVSPFCLSAIPDCRSRCGKTGGWLLVARGEKCRYNAYPQCAESRPPSVMAYGHEVTRRNTRTHFVAGAHHARRWGRTGARRRVGRRSRHIHAKQE